MALWTWWQGDPLPALAPSDGLDTIVDREADKIAHLTALDTQEVADRLAAGHRAYLARLDGEPVAYGWVASLAASIGELGLDFELPASDRYLWDFVTLPAWRGRGIYPRLLQGILTAEGREAGRFWIINAPENVASGAGILKAGFRPVGELSFRVDRGVGTQPIERAIDRARVGTALLGVPLLEAVQAGRVVAPCWRCVLGGHEAVCWPAKGGALVACTCAMPPAGA